MSLLIVVRHGQASITGEDYDLLSTLGEQQAKLTGRALGARLSAPAVIVQGSLRRHAQTTSGVRSGAGWECEVETDPRWNEFDHDGLLAAAYPQYASRPALLEDLAAHQDPNREFQRLFLGAVDRWTAGEHDGDYQESFVAFVSRVRDAAVEAAAREGTVVVSTSGGPLAVLAALSTLGSADVTPAMAHAWGRFNEVVVNAAVSKFLRGRRPSPTLLSFNDHGHFEHDRSLITYR
ncbi:histidine phosphatase family protein [Calidifontibacter indicus]|uniref:histidine phosphatase family protein n=1 Tax=Calidifontibacter indicus TaxID=419650 RepID=UPI003D73ADAB